MKCQYLCETAGSTIITSIKWLDNINVELFHAKQNKSV